MNIKLKFDFEDKTTEGLQSLKNKVKRLAGVIWSEARRLAPVDTDYLRNEIQLITVAEGSYIILSNADYSSHLEYGTSAHWVYPVNKKALHWTHNNKDFFSKGHVVSGINAQPFMRPALSLGLNRFKNF